MNRHVERTGIQQVINWAFSLLGLIPYLLIVYIIEIMNIPVTQDLLIVATIIFISHLMGLVLLRRYGGTLVELGFRVHKAVASKSPVTINIRGSKPKEVADLEQAFNTMFEETEGLRRNFREMTTKMMLYTKDIEGYQERLQEEAVLRARMNRYVPQNVADQLMKAEGDLPAQHHSQEVTVLFADIRSFTALSENMMPEEVITMLNEYFDEMVEIIFRHQGILDKFVGDELMAVFGLLGQAELGAENAIRTAMEMQERLRLMTAERRLQGKPVFQVGIGINTGPVVVGNVGSKNRMDYTVIGDTVNVAARLEQIAHGGMVLIGEATRQGLPGGLRAVEKGEIKVRNRADPVKCYAVTGR
ncbi:MAG TPA: adenylate/guanylate cyclase domain-containing protein [Mariprofundaceae bacterium]|nr:adenylate/guanylate cyclase domain-containing protein [Mariprofundaceae bacterium]